MFNYVYVICDEFLKDFQKEIGVGEHTDYGLLTILKQAGPGRHGETWRDILKSPSRCSRFREDMVGGLQAGETMCHTKSKYI
jgi:hypothetical protein